MGLPSDGSYEIPPGTVYGFPCTTKDGKITIVTGLEIDAFSRERMTLTLNEINEEREGVKLLLT
jgi:malate dehydrogenase